MKKRSRLATGRISRRLDVGALAEARRSKSMPMCRAALANHSGYKQGDPDYEREINIVHGAAIKAGVRLCGPLAWQDRPDFTCFQAGTEVAAIARGVAAELGPLANTQGKPDV